MNEKPNISQWRPRMYILTTIENMRSHATGDGWKILVAQVGPPAPNSTQVLLNIGTTFYKRCESRKSQFNVFASCRMSPRSLVMNMSTVLSPSERSEARPRKDIFKFRDYKNRKIGNHSQASQRLQGAITKNSPSILEANRDLLSVVSQ